MSVVTERCRACLYFCSCDGHYVIPTCDYFLKTGQLRGCPAGDDCDKFLPADECLKFTSVALGVVRLPIKKQRIMELYEQGLNDSEISRELKISRGTVALWRRKYGLSSNATVERMVRDED